MLGTKQKSKEKLKSVRDEKNWSEQFQAEEAKR